MWGNGDIITMFLTLDVDDNDNSGQWSQIGKEPTDFEAFWIDRSMTAHLLKYHNQ